MKHMALGLGFLRKEDEEVFLSLGKEGSKDLARVAMSSARRIIEGNHQHESGDSYTTNGIMKLGGRFFNCDFKLTVLDLSQTMILFNRIDEITEESARMIERSIKSGSGGYISGESTGSPQKKTTYS